MRFGFAAAFFLFFAFGGRPTLFPYVPGPYGITISLPVFARPVSCGEFTRFVCVTLVSSSERLAPSRLIFFYLHFSITKEDA